MNFFIIYVTVMITVLLGVYRSNRQYHKRMEEVRCGHASDMIELFHTYYLEYFVPVQITIIDKILKRRRLCLYRLVPPDDDFRHHITGVRYSTYIISISQKKYFHLLLENAIETRNRDLALKVHKNLDAPGKLP